MKFLTLVAILSLTAFFNVAYAEQVTSNADEITATCNEQAQNADIANDEEKSQYVKECIESSATESDDSNQPEKG